MKRLTIIVIIAWILAILLLVIIPLPARADEVYISDRGGSHVGYILDNWLWGHASALHWNSGGDSQGWDGDSAGGDLRTLWRVDLSSIPDGSIVTAAEVVLLVNTISGGGITIILYEIANANNGWVEGTQSVAVETGSSDWNHYAHATTNWAGSAGLSTAGTDYINTSLGSVAATSTGTKTLTLNAAGRTAIEDRLASDDIEFVYYSSSYATDVYARWASSENPTTGNRPYLHITYTPPSDGAQIIVNIF